MTTDELLAAHLARFAAGDLPGILSEYTDDSVLISPQGVLRGPSQLRGVFEAVFSEFGRPGVSFELIARHVEGEVAYIAWRAETPERVYAMGSDTFVVRQGHIVAQTSAVAVAPRE